MVLPPRHSCNPVMLFDAVVEKYCPENMVQIKVHYLAFIQIKWISIWAGQLPIDFPIIAFNIKLILTAL